MLQLTNRRNTDTTDYWEYMKHRGFLAEMKLQSRLYENF